MGRRILYISIILTIFLISHACGIVTSYSDKIFGNGSLKRDYYIPNEKNDSAKISVDIKNATYYEFNYNNYSDELHCGASIDLIVKHAESISCSGEAKNRTNNSLKIITIIENGTLHYTNSATASIQGVDNSQEIINATADRIEITGTSLGNTENLSSIIMANHSNNFWAANKLHLGKYTLPITRVEADTGPSKAASFIDSGNGIRSVSDDLAAGAISLIPIVSPNEIMQESKGTTLGASFSTVIENVDGSKISLNTEVGSGNLINLSQRASDIGTSNTMEYEYIAVNYSTSEISQATVPYRLNYGTAEYNTAFVECVSDIFLSKHVVNSIMADHCEHIQISQEADLKNEVSTINQVNAITGPMKVESFIEEGECKLNSIADVVFGVISIDQKLNPNGAIQDSKGVIGGCKLETGIAHANGNKTHLYNVVGSGNLLTLSQDVSGTGTTNIMEYEYMPTSYQTGTQDLDVAYMSGKSKIGSNTSVFNSIVASNCEHLQGSQNMSLDEAPLTITKAKAIAGPLKIESNIAQSGRVLAAMNDVAAGVVSIDQLINLNGSQQASKGVICGGNSETMAKYVDGKKTYADTMVGSGNLINLYQQASWKDAHNNVEYEYMPVSYQTGTYDIKLNSSKVEF